MVADNIKLYEAWEEECDFPAYLTIPIPAVKCMDLIAEGKMDKSQVDDLGDVLIGKVPAKKKEVEPIAVALKAAGVMVHRHTKKYNKPRGVFCAIGRCTDCVMVVNGKANVRTCITPLQENMVVETQYGLSAKKKYEEVLAK